MANKWAQVGKGEGSMLKGYELKGTLHLCFEIEGKEYHGSVSKKLFVLHEDELEYNMYIYKKRTD